MCSSPATLRFGAFALGQHADITSFKLTVTKKIEIFDSLEDNLGIKIDLLTEASISPYLIEKIRNIKRN